MENYSIKLDNEVEKDILSNSPKRLRPGNDFVDHAQDLLDHKRQKSVGLVSKQLDGIMAYKNRAIRENQFSKYPMFNKRSGSTYEQSFDDSVEKRSKSKALNKKINFKLEELSNSCKFPPIPRSIINDTFIQK